MLQNETHAWLSQVVGWLLPVCLQDACQTMGSVGILTEQMNG